ncbi:hypothetical protein [Trichormus azollae]|jgi:hypothetical protein|uniref:hypothetical protein n=1 Tax=Trichormus azollae TaxID=1164 RepID=UPI0001957AC5|nr:hypothetical protein [Trichormus azollae]
MLGNSIESQSVIDDEERLDFLHELDDEGWQTFDSVEPLLEEVDSPPTITHLNG